MNPTQSYCLAPAQLPAQISYQAFAKLEQRFDEFFCQATGDCLPALAELLTATCQLGQIKQLLEALLTSADLLAKVAARSYWHGNGFLKIVLLDKGYKLRLHIWFAGVVCEENIHSHRWGFASHILTGTLKSELWQDAAMTMPAAVMLNEYLYTAKHHNHPANKVFLQKTALLKAADVAQHAGSSYIMYPHELHKINHPGEQLVATMICTTPTDVLTNRLFPSQENPELAPDRLTADELSQAIKQFLALC